MVQILHLADEKRVIACGMGIGNTGYHMRQRIGKQWCFGVPDERGLQTGNWLAAKMTTELLLILA